MSVILILILASLAIALLFLGGFIWAVRSGQFEDTVTPSMRVLMDDKCNGTARRTRNHSKDAPSAANPGAADLK